MEIEDIVRTEYIEHISQLKKKIKTYENDTTPLGHQIYLMSNHTYEYILKYSPLQIKDYEV